VEERRFSAALAPQNESGFSPVIHFTACHSERNRTLSEAEGQRGIRCSHHSAGPSGSMGACLKSAHN
jgi:hypothetical protein